MRRPLTGGVKRVSILKRAKDLKHQSAFGTGGLLPETLNRKPLAIRDQGASFFCTAFATSEAGGFLHGADMSPEWSTANVGYEAGAPIFGGTDPHTAMQAALDRGFLPSKLSPLSFLKDGWTKPALWINYAGFVDNQAMGYRPGSQFSVKPDFDSVKEALNAASGDNGVVMAFGFWFAEWNTAANVPALKGILPVGATFTGRHAYLFIDWRSIAGKEYLVAQLSQGDGYGDHGLLYVSREVFEKAWANPVINGLGLYVFRSVEGTEAEKIGLLKQLVALLQELKSLLTPATGSTDSGLSTVLQQLSAGLVSLLGILNVMKAKVLDVETIYPDWHNPTVARHNLRVICDQEGLTSAQKNVMSQVVHCESGYNVSCVHPNLTKSGKVASTDYGICQWNDFYHGKEMPPAKAVSDPEAAVRLMCQYVKAGKISQWVCYSAGLYQHYSA